MVETLESMVELVKGFVGDSGSCSYDRAAKAINQARRLLWNKREWNATAEYACIKCVDGCFTLPNRYEQIKLAWLDGNPASLADEWFNATGFGQEYYSRGFRDEYSVHRLITEVGGKHVVFNEYTLRPYQILALGESQLDEGVKLLFEAYDQYGSYSNVKVPIQNQYTKAIAPDTIVAIRAVSKPLTNGRVRIYAYDPVIDMKFLIAIYQADDVNPTFRRFRIPKKVECITIYATKKYKDLEDKKELVEFSPDAMIYAILALNSRENRKAQEFINNLNLAVAEAEKEMEGDEIPTAAPIRFASVSRPENLIGGYWGYPSNSDYFLRP